MLFRTLKEKKLPKQILKEYYKIIDTGKATDTIIIKYNKFVYCIHHKANIDNNIFNNSHESRQKIAKKIKWEKYYKDVPLDDEYAKDPDFYKAKKTSFNNGQIKITTNYSKGVRYNYKSKMNSDSINIEETNIESKISDKNTLFIDISENKENKSYRRKNAGKTYEKIYNIVLENLLKNPKSSYFITLTSQHKIDIENIGKEIYKFLRSLKSKKIEKKLGGKFFRKYIYVIGLQKRKNPHIHIVFFDIPENINKKLISEKWKYGIIDTQKIGLEFKITEETIEIFKKKYGKKKNFKSESIETLSSLKGKILLSRDFWELYNNNTIDYLGLKTLLKNSKVIDKSDDTDIYNKHAIKVSQYIARHIVDAKIEKKLKGVKIYRTSLKNLDNPKIKIYKDNIKLSRKKYKTIQRNEYETEYSGEVEKITAVKKFRRK